MITSDFKTIKLTEHIFDKEIRFWKKEQEQYMEQYRKTKSPIPYEISMDIKRIVEEIEQHKRKVLEAVREYENGIWGTN